MLRILIEIGNVRVTRINSFYGIKLPGNTHIALQLHFNSVVMITWKRTVSILPQQNIENFVSKINLSGEKFQNV